MHRLEQHSDTVHAVAFSPAGRLLASTGYDGQVGLFELETGEGQLSRAAESGRIAAVEFTPDGKALITAHIEERRLRHGRRDGLRLTNGRTIAQLSD